MPSQPQDLVFGAYNSTTVDADTSLFITLLDPVADKDRVQALLAMGDLRERIDTEQLTLCGAEGVDVESAFGPDRGVIKDPYDIPEQEDPSRIPIGVIGPAARDTTDALVAKAGAAGRFQSVSGPVGVSLRAAEVQQVALRLTQATLAPKAAYLVLIEHFLDAERKLPIGSFPYLFTT